MKCTICGREFEPAEGQRFCSFCGGNIESHPGRETDSTEPEFVRDEEISDSPGYCPWEDQEKLGFLQGLFMTLRQSMVTPAEFFARMPVHGGFANPLLYSLIVSTTATLFYCVWGMLLGNPMVSNLDLSGSILVMTAIMIPLGILLGILIWAGMLHLSLSLVGGAGRDFEATLRVVCYTSGPDLFKAVPYIGFVVAFVWRVYITIVGLREVHRISTGLAVLAFALPTMLCCGVVFGLVMFLTAMMVHS